MNSLQSLKLSYRSRHDNLSKDFFLPCLRECVTYKRAVGYFTTGALGEWIGAVENLVGNEKIKIQLIIAPILPKQDKAALLSITTNSDLKDEYLNKVAKEFIQGIVSRKTSNATANRELLLWLIAHSKLEIRFAFLDDVDADGIYHEKLGVFHFPDDRKVAFEGSANETSGGYLNNKEKLMVFKSWEPKDVERVRDTEEDFDVSWDNKESGITVIEMSPESLALVREYAPKHRPSDAVEHLIPKQNNWKHQDEAISVFLKHRHGVLEMATGTGKTRTALRIATHLVKSSSINSIIITTDGIDLLAQWYEELLDWNEFGIDMAFYRQFDTHSELLSYSYSPTDSILLISRQKLHEVLKRIASENAQKIMIIHDEVHGLGSHQNVLNLSGLHDQYIYKLGLSATPEREYDVEGTEFITQSVGKTIYTFGLEDAISAGVLCEFNYVPIEYDLSDDDRMRLKKVYSRQAARRREGIPMKDSEFWTELSRVYKTAENKPAEFADFLKREPECYKNSIIFVEEKEYGNRILPILQLRTNRYRTYYAEDDTKHLYDFASGNIDCLITCHKISQGIDIRRLKAVILFSSAASKLETIQRIGRCLRTDPDNPDKRATVIDFVRRSVQNDDNQPEESKQNADDNRRTWLTKLSKIRRAV